VTQTATTSEQLDSLDLEILRLLASGATGHALARTINLPPRTAQRRIQDMKRRFGATSTIEVVVDAVRRGLV
jgi:DNA-binding NarL/FixJ family response regulator